MQSAPPGRTDFVALSLRPVYTVFSSRFGDHMLGQRNEILSKPAPDAESGTPTTGTGDLKDLTSEPGFRLTPQYGQEIGRPMTVTSTKSSSESVPPYLDEFTAV